MWHYGFQMAEAKLFDQQMLVLEQRSYRGF
jgi:hypothetical protein